MSIFLMGSGEWGLGSGEWGLGDGDSGMGIGGSGIKAPLLLPFLFMNRPVPSFIGSFLVS